LTNSADPFAYFVNSIIHSSTGALGWATGTGASENKKAGKKDNKGGWFHLPFFKHARSDRFKP
jgi:hypothetical protein